MRLFSILLACAVSLIGQTADLAERLQQAAVAYAESQAAGQAGTTVIRVLRPPAIPKLPAGEVRFEATHASKTEFAGPFFVAFRLYVDQRPAGITRVDLQGTWKGTLVRSRTALARKAVPEEAQLESFDFEGIPPAGALTAFPAGHQLKAAVAAGRILTRSDIQPIPLINIGDPVRLALVYGSAMVTSETVARTSGVLGDRIRLELPNHRRVIQATITGPGEARIEWVRTDG